MTKMGPRGLYTNLSELIGKTILSKPDKDCPCVGESLGNQIRKGNKNQGDELRSDPFPLPVIVG
jgi:hypothetical protein